jgi:uncharacterized protein (TIGR00266 family)
MNKKTLKVKKTSIKSAKNKSKKQWGSGGTSLKIIRNEDRDLIMTKHLTRFSEKSFHIPEYRIYHKPSNASIVMNLKDGQSVFANAGMMVWMDKKISVSTQTRGLFNAFKRALLTSDSFFLTSYAGVSPKGNKICFAPTMTGDIIELKIKPGEKKLVASHGVIVCTENIVLETRTRLRGIFVSETPFLSELIVPKESRTYGVAWIAAYGGIETIDIRQNEVFSVDNGHFLTCDGDVQYSIGTVGGLKSTLFSGEGFTMDFTGPCRINIQNRSMRPLIEVIGRHIRK